MKHVKIINRPEKKFSIEHKFLRLEACCTNHSDEEFKTFLSNMEGILDRVDEYTRDFTYGHAIIYICLYTLNKHPVPINDLDKFLGFVTSTFFEYLHYYMSAFEKTAQKSVWVEAEAIVHYRKYSRNRKTIL